ncbi:MULTISPECIES: dipicolinate synthase subunit DpsA [Caproicibacterium]|uniref:Dipicolinate synthase subunit DpsA n=1 Tax=Caproicibacterium argilliputei TaxID=3030016 RepID=A0AA97D8V2_9FIRM|nr:dipicolinate synthase subunit DpsA [Caproicibacterium argilliputei]WOC31178.1 dipicolinate synthase subunit DpsA [Caproicibacterium argilliputei]
MLINRNSFGIIGGDRRQLALAESIAGDGFLVYACGFEKAEFGEAVQKADLKKTAAACATILLPLPITADGVSLKAEYAEHPILLNESFAELLQNHRVYAGMPERAVRVCPALAQVGMQDYSAREDFALRNAAVTAEGAIECAMREFPGTICGSRCLIAGFGRIGSQLAPRLRALGAAVSVTVRRAESAAAVEAAGCRAVPLVKLGDGGEYDFLFNTVPDVLFTQKVLSVYPRGTLLIDLSSAPGGVDMEAAKKLGIRAIHAFSLPAKVAPRTAGEIIKQTVYHMMRE